MRHAIAIVLARAGSRGLPGKNSLPVAGKPCAQWTLEAARDAHRVDRVVLSTDDGVLARLAAAMGIETVDRPAALAGDSARVDDAARHALDAAEPHAPDDRPVVILYANVPVRPPDLIDRAVDLLTASGCDSVQSYAPVGKHHPWWTVRLGHDGRVRPWEGEVLNHGVFRRQDLPPALVPDGGVIALTARALRLRIPGVGDGPHAFLGLDRRGLVTGEGDVIDIDSEIDRRVAHAVLCERQEAQA